MDMGKFNLGIDEIMQTVEGTIEVRVKGLWLWRIRAWLACHITAWAARLIGFRLKILLEGPKDEGI
ncbi:hypothetical protein LCGC14_2117670 [marine sediment metagenome]|uniref:Uncharacterized protein n=1 Tax=marine sediment metagenome TaxID=412755 RepID=A0A0F9GI89_9ZZZZ